MRLLSRRRLMQGGLATALGATMAATPGDEVPAPALRDLIRHKLLADTLYRHSVSQTYDDTGAAGTNTGGYSWIEEQRQGAEWIVRGSVERRAEWMALGWKQLDWGLGRQQADGGFASRDPFHSTSFFLEALARSCLIDPAQATERRIRALIRAARWQMSPTAEEAGVGKNEPFTHRRFILAAGFGQAGAVTGDAAFAAKAESWAVAGLALQRPDGTNPEKDGFDAGYQMVGVLMALRYLPVCANPGLRAQLRTMIRRAVARELREQAPDGSLDTAGSTRIGAEHARNGEVKEVPYGEILQALVYGAQAVPEPGWLEPARRIATLRRW